MCCGYYTPYLTEERLEVELVIFVFSWGQKKDSILRSIMMI